MLCPVCKVDLRMTDRQGVEIDYCPKCRGVWLDRGELDKLIERSAVPQQSAPPPQYREQRRDYDEDDRYYDKKKKRGSFLSELFDF